MQERHKMYEEMDYVEMDICDPLVIEEDSFNFIIDKGCLDCIICAEHEQGADL